MDLKDYTPTADQITLHGLGFIQVKLPANKRLHVWHPLLPRRDCFVFSAIHNHRFSFRSTVLIGTQKNRRYHVIPHPEGTHDIISHDGPRSPMGGRESFVAGRCNVESVQPRYMVESYSPGQSYEMRELEYHETPNTGVVVTLMEKLHEGRIHASTIITHGREFHQAFDRFQLRADELWAIVVEALKHGDK